MASFARVPREPLWASNNASKDTGSPLHSSTTNMSKTPQQRKGRQRKWKSIDVDAITSENPLHIENSGNKPSADAPSTPVQSISHLHDLQELLPLNSSIQPHEKTQATNMIEPRKSLPPHLRQRAENVTAPLPDAGEPSQEADARPKAPISPPSTQEQDDSESAKPDRAPHTTHNSRARWPRPRRGKWTWPKNRDIRPDTRQEGSDGGVSFKSDSGGDPNYDIKKLLDWEGNWLPAPVEWASRKSFADRHFAQTIYQWMIQIDRAYGISQKPDRIHPHVLVPAKDNVEAFKDGGEVAPSSWIPIQIEGDSPQQFWRTFPSRAPEALSDIDPKESRPWWAEYPEDNGKLFMLAHVNVPEARLDPGDQNNRHPGVGVSAEEAVNRRQTAHLERIRRTLEKRNRPSINNPQVLGADHKPTANIYLRPVSPFDIPQLTDIYNHYVKFSVHANEFNERSNTHIGDRIADITGRGLPWIVAVHKGNIRGRKKQVGFMTENIVGFTSIDDYCDEGSMYRFTYELEIFVHPDHLRQDIGKCLLDRLLHMVNPGYIAKGDYEWNCQSDYLKNGCSRVVKVINVPFPHVNGDAETVEWMTSFMKNLGFRKAGRFANVGYKLGKAVDVTTYQHETTEVIEADKKPALPL